MSSVSLRQWAAHVGADYWSALREFHHSKSETGRGWVRFPVTHLRAGEAVTAYQSRKGSAVQVLTPNGAEELEEMAQRLRAAGWTVTPPACHAA